MEFSDEVQSNASLAVLYSKTSTLLRFSRLPIDGKPFQVQCRYIDWCIGAMKMMVMETLLEYIPLLLSLRSTTHTALGGRPAVDQRLVFIGIGCTARDVED